jgi:pSer/pThr/pTyr-binding forkhead associated (FHA) protein
MLSAHGFDNVSRQHAEFRIADGEAVIVDLGSSNGTFLNGARLTARVPERLPERATVRFGADLEVAISVAREKHAEIRLETHE